MTQRQRIKEMEKILDYHVDKPKELHSLLGILNQQMEFFKQLVNTIF